MNKHSAPSMVVIAPCLLAMSLVTSVAIAGQAVAARSDNQSMAADQSLDAQIAALQSDWARVNYQIPAKDRRIEAFEALAERSEQLVSSFPSEAAPKIWHGIILSSHAGTANALSALSKVKKAKVFFEQALAIDENALDGSAHTSLGSLYYKVPGWPLGFGSDKKAEAHLKKALAVNPQGIDPNFFYGEFLFEQGEYDEAARVLTTALQAPDRPQRPLADAGRREEIEAVLAKVKKKLKR